MRTIPRVFAGIYLGINAAAGAVLILISIQLRTFFVVRGAAEVGDSLQAVMLVMVLVLWSTAAVTIWKTPREPFK